MFKAERQARAKAERQRSDLAREAENLNERLNEACGATAVSTNTDDTIVFEHEYLRPRLS